MPTQSSPALRAADVGRVAAPTRLGATLLLALSLVLLWALASASQLQTVAERPWPLAGVPGLLLPAVAVIWLAPAVLALGTLALAVPSLRSGAASALLVRAAMFIAWGALVGLWLACLMRHDRLLSLWHCAAVLLATLPQLRLWARRLMLLAATAALLALVSYGAIWGEKRCDEPYSPGCLVDGGPRVWVPELLALVRVPAFVDLRSTDLRGVDWRGRDLRLADLRGTQLEGATLAGSNLRRARLDDTVAPGLDLQRAFMTGASLRGADLSGADLREVHAYMADLRDARLERADLRGASLSHSRMKDLVLTDAQLQGAYVRFAEGLTAQMLDQARIDPSTRLPDGLPGR